MSADKQEKKGSKVLSRTGLVLGAAGLLMFIIGVKRSYQLDEEHTVGEEERRRDTKE
jgi:hypothetical protein